MKNIFEFAAFCLQNNAIEQKLQATHRAKELCHNGNLDFTSRVAPLPISSTLFPERPLLCDPRTMPKRKFTTLQGKIGFFHALVHIEFMAIYLAWDIIYRFRDLPQKFYQDWLRVADEEAQHFVLLRQHLQELGSDYGKLSAHRGLWEVAVDSADDLIARLALVPRYMEARGLDVTPGMIEKFKDIGDHQGVEILSRILKDEISHVELGSYWFNTICEQRKFDPEKTYREMITTRLKGKPRVRINRDLRKTAGFSETELDWLETLSTN